MDGSRVPIGYRGGSGAHADFGTTSDAAITIVSGGSSPRNLLKINHPWLIRGFPIGKSSRSFSLVFPQSIAMAFSTGWKPSVGGEELAPFAAYADLVDDDARPYSQRDPDWATRNIRAQLGAVPIAVPAIQESVVGLWRLKQLEEKLEDASEQFVSDWQQYVSAWLVSRITRVAIGAG